MCTSCVAVLFIAVRISDLLAGFFSPRFIPYLGFFPYKEVFHQSHLPSYIFSYANFDGVHYIRTASMGYSQFAQAFFPLYPLIIRYGSFLFGGNMLLAGLVFSNIFFLAGLLIFNKYLKLCGYEPSRIKWMLLFLCVYPASFFFGAVYNTSLFFFLAGAALLFFKKKLFLLAGICSFLAALTRLEGVLLIIPFMLPLISKPKIKFTLQMFFVLISPVAGLLVFTSYLWITTGDPMYFLHSQPAFGANRSSNIILLPQVLFRYIKIFVTANHDFRYWVSVLEFTMFTLALGILLFQLKNLFVHLKKKQFTDELGLNLFSICNLILPTLTGTLSSIPRYSLMSISIFIALSAIGNKYMKAVIAIIFFAAHIILLMYFIQGYFVS